MEFFFAHIIRLLSEPFQCSPESRVVSTVNVTHLKVILNVVLLGMSQPQQPVNGTTSQLHHLRKCEKGRLVIFRSDGMPFYLLGFLMAYRFLAIWGERWVIGEGCYCRLLYLVYFPFGFVIHLEP